MRGSDLAGGAVRSRRAGAPPAGRGAFVRLALVALSLSSIATSIAWADVERVEAIGFVAMTEGEGAGQIAPRDSAIRSAMYEAVHQVARRFLDQQEGPRPTTPPNLNL